MVQPRKEQLKNVLTRHSRFSFSAVPGSLETSVPAAALDLAVVSGLPGGVQEDVPAYAWGATEPLPILASDAISVKKGSAPAVTVTFSGTDTTASRVAAAVNAAAGSTIAYNVTGRLLIRDDVTGSGSLLVLADVVAGVLAKLGLVAGTMAGYDTPVRGVVTEAPDALGGHALLRTPDGKNVVTDCPSLSQVGSLSAFVQIADLPGGVPVHARLRWDQGTSSYLFQYHARLPVGPEAVTAANRFDLLDGTNVLTLAWTTGIPEYPAASVAVTFSGGPGLTPYQVVSAINAAFTLAVTGGSDGGAVVSGHVGQPYSFSSGETIEVSVDGGSLTPVAFGTSTVTADDVATLFNAAVTGATATWSIDAYGNSVLQFKSDNTDGLTSSLEIRNAVPGVLEKLGMSPGKYVGHWVAEPYGSSEIRIRGLGRGPGASLTVSGSVTTLTRAGLTAGTYYGSDEGEVSVGFPIVDQANPSAPSSVVALVPEVLEFGEVRPAVESTIEQFNARSAGSNLGVSTSSSAVLSLAPTGGRLIGRSRGVADGGKPVVTNALGLIDTSFLRAVRDDSYRFFKKMIRGNFAPGINSVDALVTPVIETPGAEGNAGLNVAQLWIDIERPDLLASRSLRVRFGKLGSPKIPFMVTELGLAGAEWLINGQDTAGDGTAFGNSAGPMKLLDANTDAAGTAVSGTRFIPLTSSAAAEGDRTLRIMELEDGVTEPVSLFRQVNGRWVTTCGDGTTSFGDFNGPDAIQQALAFYVANVPPAVGGLVLELKEGRFVVNSTYGTVDVPADTEVTLIGKSYNLTQIRNEDATSGTIVVAASGILILRGLTVYDAVSTGSNAADLGSSARLQAQDVYFLNNKLRFENSESALLERCQFDNAGAAVPNVQIVMGDGLGTSYHKDFVFVDCSFVSADHNPVLSVSAVTGALSITRVRSILFERCSMSLGTTTSSSGSLTGNCGVLDLDSRSTDARLGQGAVVDRVTYRNCRVDANRNSGAVSVLIHLIPQTNGVSFDAGNDFLGITRLEIDGGRWLAPAVSTTFNPFTIFEVGTAVSTAAMAEEDGGLYIRNVVMGFGGTEADTGILHGSSTADIDGSLYRGSGDSSSTDAKWAAWTMGGPNIELDNVSFTGFSQYSNSGAIAVRWNRFKMRNCTLSRFKAGGPGALASIFRARPRTASSTEYFEVKDLDVKGRAASGSWGSIFEVEPNAPDGTRTHEGPMTWEDVHVSGFSVAGGPVSSVLVKCDGLAAANDYWTGSPASYRNLTVRNCNVNKIGALLDWATLASGPQNFMTNVRINGNEASEGSNYGIRLWGGQPGGEPQFDFVEIKDNRIWGYQLYGIWLAQDYWAGTVPNGAQVSITGNRVFGTAGSVQIYVSTFAAQVDAATFGQRIHGTIRDNDVMTHSSALAYIEVDGRSLAGAIVSVSGGVNPADFNQAPIHDVATGWDYTGVNAQSRFVTNTALMLYNRAHLLTP